MERDNIIRLHRLAAARPQEPSDTPLSAPATSVRPIPNHHLRIVEPEPIDLYRSLEEQTGDDPDRSLARRLVDAFEGPMGALLFWAVIIVCFCLIASGKL